MSHGYQLDY